MQASNLFLLRESVHPIPAPQRAMPRAGIQLARFKLGFINKFIAANAVHDLIDFGCGGGAKTIRQLRVAAYTGVAPASALAPCQGATGDPTRRWYVPDAMPKNTSATLSLSMDIMQRLASDSEFNIYIRTMFEAARRFVIIHAGAAAPAWAGEAASTHGRVRLHVRRFFPGWELAAQMPNPYTPAANFLVYARQGSACTIPVIAPL